MNKKQRQQFVKESEEKILEAGGKYMGDVFGTRLFMISGETNFIILKLQPENEHKDVYSVFGKFDLNCTLAPNTKFNYHGFDPDITDYLSKILNELK